MKITLASFIAAALVAALSNPAMAIKRPPPTTEGCWESTGIACTASNGQRGILFQACDGTSVRCIATDGNFSGGASLGGGGNVRVGGHAVCDEGRTADLRVTITQQGTGALAEAREQIECSGEIVQWDLIAETLGSRGFIAGGATACGLLRVRAGEDDAADAFQWCKTDLEIAP